MISCTMVGYLELCVPDFACVFCFYDWTSTRILYRFGLTEDHLWKAVQITKNAHKAPGSQL